jgi:hypothetical protein
MFLLLLQSASSSYLLLKSTPCESDETGVDSLAAITLEKLFLNLQIIYGNSLSLVAFPGGPETWMKSSPAS